VCQKIESFIVARLVGLDMGKNPTDLSGDEILEMIQRCKDQHGECTPQQFRDGDFCPVSLVSKRFGSWNAALKKADIAAESTKRHYSTEQILSQLRELNRREGSCTQEQLDQHDEFLPSSVVTDHFDSWKVAKAHAELTSAEVDLDYSDEEICEMLRKCEQKHGECTPETFSRDGEFPRAGFVRERFGTWREAQSQAGINLGAV
jgi:hypothetical protein